MTDKTIYDALWINANIATMAGDGYGLIQGGAIAVEDGRIAWIGEMQNAPKGSSARRFVDVKGGLITPALIDCHTHLIYGGDRAAEFEQRLNGSTYEDIAKAGGGILSTVRATREASEEGLYVQALHRLTILRKGGVGVFEIKSGYGLDLASEEKMLRVATRLRDETGLFIQRTFLGAHALSPEFAGDADGYIDYVCHDMIPSLAKAGLMDAVDVFCERIAFSAAQSQRVFEAAKAAGLPVKIHAEQLSNMGGAALAARYQALSADHLEYLDEEGVRAMAEHGSVAVILPAAFYTIKETQKPPIDALRRYGVPMALATDHNPGSSPALSLVLMMNMGCTLFGMTPLEALRGVTIHAARALGVSERYGTLELGKEADFVVWDAAQPAELSYRFGHAPVRSIVRQGKDLSL